jgi:hypothetical protein
MFIPSRWIEVLSSLTIVKIVKREFLAFSPIPVSLFGASDKRLDYVPHYTLISLQPLII